MKDLHHILLTKKLTVATAESLTAGMIAAELASLSGSSAYFRGGIVAYNLAAKVDLLGVDAALAASCDCVSAEVADQMALGVQRRFQTDCAIAVTGYAERPANLGGPFANYTLLYGERRLTGVVHGGMRSRNSVRRFVTRMVLRHLVLLVGP